MIDLNFLGVYDLLLLRGDVKTLEAGQNTDLYHEHATDLQEQVNNFNKGIAVDGSTFEANETPFSYGMACYPEKHEEAPNMESDIFYLKEKVKNGADYLVTQMFSIMKNIIHLWNAAVPKVSMSRSSQASSRLSLKTS